MCVWEEEGTYGCGDDDAAEAPVPGEDVAEEGSGGRIDELQFVKAAS